MTVSIFKSVKDPNSPFNRDVLYALNRIKTGNSKALVEQLRVMNADDYKKNKEKLPGVCFNGKFRTRSASGLIEHSGLIVLDFDKFLSHEDAVKYKKKICKDEHVFAAWISPSNTGIKVLVKIPKEPKKHKNYFEALKVHFNSEFWDESGSDVSRFCFESYDPNIYTNYDSTTWLQIEEPEVRDVGTTEPMIAVTSTNIIVSKLLVWWTAKYGMTDGKKNTNLFILAKAFFDFGISESEALHECLKFDQGGKEIEITKIVNSSYKSGQSGTKFFEDIDTRTKIEKRIRAGATKSELEKEFSNVNISALKDEMQIGDFWYYNDKGRIILSNNKYKFWLEQNNFYKYYPSPTSPTFTFIKKNQNLLEETSDKKIKDYVLNDILNRTDIGYGPFDFMSGNTSYFKSDFLSMLSTTEVNMKYDTVDAGYLYYKNCVVEVTKDAIRKLDYIDVDGFIWKRQIIDRDFEQSAFDKSEFRRFIWLISGQDETKYNTFKSVIGYLLHSFKTSANNKAIIFNDSTISDNPNGGSGKGLFWNALQYMKKVTRIDGKSFEPNKSFPYALVSTDTQILVFDDVKRNFQFESLFSLITEGITLEYKGQDPFTVPVEQSPKIIITTNYTVGGIGGSFERRKFEVEMSAFFNYQHTPLHEFGHMLFSDWTDKEWLYFDNFMIGCYQYYLENGLVQHEFDNLDARKFHKETSFEFHEWSQEEGNISQNVRLDKEVLFTKFLHDYPDFKVPPYQLKQKKFTSWLVSYAKYHKLNEEQGRTHNMRFIEFSDPKSGQAKKTEDDDSDIPF